MANIIRSVQGYFDVLEYNAKKPREQWKIKGNDGSITFGVRYDSLPEQFQQYAKPYTTKNNTTAYMVKFKIGQNCKWFGPDGTAIQRPDNATLHDKRFEVNIQYATLNGDPTQKEASGYWANAIMYHEVQSNPFEGMAFEEPVETAAPAPAPEELPADIPF